MQNINEYGQPIGPELSNWIPRDLPCAAALVGEYCRLERVDITKHADSLFAAYQDAQNGPDWTYLSAGPFSGRTAFIEYVRRIGQSQDPFHYAVIDRLSGKALGTLALMRIDAIHGTIEVGFVVYSAALKRTRIATEAQFLLMEYALGELGYRRYEWKCDALNAPSRAAALRLGFTFEGIFRNAMVYKNRSRDTAWYSITIEEWPRLRHCYEHWLSPLNFDGNGKQLASLDWLGKGERSRSKHAD